MLRRNVFDCAPAEPAAVATSNPARTAMRHFLTVISFPPSREGSLPATRTPIREPPIYAAASICDEALQILQEELDRLNRRSSRALRRSKRSRPAADTAR